MLRSGIPACSFQDCSALPHRTAFLPPLQSRCGSVVLHNHTYTTFYREDAGHFLRESFLNADGSIAVLLNRGDLYGRIFSLSSGISVKAV